MKSDNGKRSARPTPAASRGEDHNGKGKSNGKDKRNGRALAPIVRAAIHAILLAVLLCCAMARAEGLPPPEQALAIGQDALSQHWYARAYRMCAWAATQTTNRDKALVCQAQAAMQLHAPGEAVALANQAIGLIGLPHQPAEVQLLAAAHVLAGDGYRLQDGCTRARTHYLLALELQPQQSEALRGVRACHDVPPQKVTP